MLPLSCDANVLCVQDADIPVEKIKESGANLLVLNKKVGVAVVFNEVQDILSAHLNFTRSSEILLDTLIHGKGVQHVVEIGCEILGNPVIVGDPGGKLIAQAKGLLKDEPYWNKHLQKGYLSYEFIHRSNFKAVHEKVNKSASPVLLKRALNLKRNSIMGKIKVDNIIVANLTVIEYERPFKKKDMELIALLCDVISLHFYAM
ncbi:MAG: hypothetical protein QHH06_05260 [Clostridiales bacterium]|jgi:hypothetical protein|nr:hypothetical protein [Clostridiales bacterium]